MKNEPRMASTTDFRGSRILGSEGKEGKVFQKIPPNTPCSDEAVPNLRKITSNQLLKDRETFKTWGLAGSLGFHGVGFTVIDGPLLAGALCLFSVG